MADEVKRQRDVERKTVNQLMDQATNILRDKNHDYSTLVTAVTQLEGKRSELHGLNEEIVDKLELEVDDDIRNASEFADKISEMCTELRAAMKEVPHPKHPFRLPKLKPIEYHGQYDQWSEFWPYFNYCVHEKRKISKCDKFKRLKKLLIGSKFSYVHNLPITEDNYDRAIEHLTYRFGRKEVQIDTYMNKFLNDVVPVKKAKDLDGLWKLYCLCTVTMISLRGLGVPPTRYEIALKSSLLRAIPYSMRLDYFRKHKDVWKLTEFLDYVNIEVKVLRRLQR